MKGLVGWPWVGVYVTADKGIYYEWLVGGV